MDTQELLKYLNNRLFELSDTMAEELINLAIIFATNTVESSKLQQLVSLLNLES